MSKWYEATRYFSGQIEVVEVTRESAKCLWVETEYAGRKSVSRVSKVSDSGGYFRTFAEAKQSLVDGCSNRISRLEMDLADERARLARMEALTEVEQA